MRKEDLFQEIGEIDEDLIEEAAEIGDRRLHWKKYMDLLPLVAACFVLIWVVGKTELFQPSKEAETTAASAITTAAAMETTAAAEEEMESYTGGSSHLEDRETEGFGEETNAASSSETEVETATTAEITTSPEMIIPWDEMEVYQQYAQFEWEDRSYKVLEEELTESELGERLASITVSSVDMNQITHEISAEIWLVQGFKEEHLLAIRYEGDNRFFGAKVQ